MVLTAGPLQQAWAFLDAWFGTLDRPRKQQSENAAAVGYTYY
jgi:hypothetical protein